MKAQRVKKQFYWTLNIIWHYFFCIFVPENLTINKLNYGKIYTYKTLRKWSVFAKGRGWWGNGDEEVYEGISTKRFFLLQTKSIQRWSPACTILYHFASILNEFCFTLLFTYSSYPLQFFTLSSTFKKYPS